ncbi:TRAP transporter substrate-binding protein DctP [Chloroflexota bacterium]
MKKAVFILVVALLLVGVVVGCAAPAPSPTPTPTPKPAPTPSPAPKTEPIVLKALTFLPKTYVTSLAFQTFAERVAERTNGEIVIDYLGGPEVTPALEQPEALVSGVVDMLKIPCSYYRSLLPEANVFHLSRVGLEKEREPGGFRDYMIEVHEKANIRFLGRLGYTMPFYLYTNVKVDTPSDIAGQKLRTFPVYEAFIKKLNAVPTPMPVPEIYLAMSTGVIDGFFLGPGMTSVGLQEVTKYRLEHGFYTSTITIIVNLDKWNSIPADLQKLLQEVMYEMEDEHEAFFLAEKEKEDTVMQEAGVEFIEFSPADAKWYVDTANEAYWELTAKSVSPEVYNKLRSLLTD